MSGDEESRLIRAARHEYGFDTLQFVRFAGDQRIRVAQDDAGRVWDATHHQRFGWGPWHRVNTHSFDRYAQAVMR